MIVHPQLSCDRLDVYAVYFVSRNRGCSEFRVARGRHLFTRRKIHPELKTAHATLFLLWHFRMNNARPRLHPLHITGHELTDVAHVIAVLHMPFEHVGYRLETAVRMRRKPADVVARIIGSEFIKH